MHFSLSFEELFAALLLHRVDEVLGWDFGAELPQDPGARQALYDAGERALMSRDLLRTTPAGSAQMERNLQRFVTAMGAPKAVVMGVFTDPSRGSQRRTFFVSDAVAALSRGQDDRFVLNELGSAAEVAPRLLEMLPPTREELGEATAVLPMPALVSAVQAAIAGEQDRRDGLPAGREATSEFVSDFAKTLDQITGVLTVSMTGPAERQVTRELAVITGPEGGWLAIAEPDGNARVAAMASDQLAVALKTAVAAYIASACK